MARNILSSIDGRTDELEEFKYRPLGQLVELGSHFAVNEIMGVRFSGLLAALFWRAVYLTKLESPKTGLRSPRTGFWGPSSAPPCPRSGTP